MRLEWRRHLIGGAPVPRCELEHVLTWYAARTAVEHCRMQQNSDYYREEAAKYRELADMAKDAVTKQELLELAAACEGIADKIDDLGASG